MVERIQVYALDKAVATKEGDYSTVNMWGLFGAGGGKTIIDSQYLRDSITGSVTGNSREYAVQLRTAGVIRLLFEDTK